MKCIINFAKGSWYPRGQDRLFRSLYDIKYDGHIFRYNDESEVGSPLHSVSPYAFKVAAIRKAVNDGFKYVTWVDASVWAIRDTLNYDSYLSNNSHFFVESGFNTATWSSDTSLESFGISRDDAETMPMLMAIFFGLNFNYDVCHKWLDRMEEKANDGKTFFGSWNNDSLSESKDARCKGHRHDQTAASIIASQLGMKLNVGHESYFQYYYGNMEEIGNSVTFVAQGM